MLIQQFVEYPGSNYTTAGEAWRQVRNQWIIPYGAALLFITLLALAIFFFTKGPIGHHEGLTGPRIERFTPFERAAHWTNATAWVVLAVSGLVMAFGKFFLLPIIGGTLFGWLTYALKNLHNFVGPLFVVSLLVVFFTFLRSNWPTQGRRQVDRARRRRDRRPGSAVAPLQRRREDDLLGRRAVLLGMIVIGSGLYLDKVLPGMDYLRGDMQVANMVHGVGGTADDGCLPRPHLHGNDRHARRLSRDARRLCRRRVGQGTPPAVVRRHQARQDPGPAVAAGGRAGTGRRTGGRTTLRRRRPPPARPIATLSARTCPRKSRMPIAHRLLVATVCAVLAQSAVAKLPPPSEEAKLKAAEAALKADHGAKVAAFQLCKAQDRAAAAYRKKLQADGKMPNPANEGPACVDPGAAAGRRCAREGGRALQSGHCDGGWRDRCPDCCPDCSRWSGSGSGAGAGAGTRIGARIGCEEALTHLAPVCRRGCAPAGPTSPCCACRA